MSSVRKRILGSGDIRWQVDYKDQEGKRRAKQFMTKREATEFETKVRSEIAAGVHTADTASVIVRQAGELWLTKCERFETSCFRPVQRRCRAKFSPA